MYAWPNLEELNADGSEHELEQDGDEHNVVDGSNGDDDTLNDMLSQTLMIMYDL